MNDDWPEIPTFLLRNQPKETPMARKKKQTDETEVETDDVETNNGIGHNKPPTELTDEQTQVLTFQHKKAYETDLAAQKAAAAKFKNTCKLIKAELGDDGVALIKDMIALESEDGEAKIRAEMERKMRAARYMAAPLGSQFEMFDDRMPAEDRAFAEGRRDAMAGEALNNPYDSSVPQSNSYAEGWHAGQKATIDAQKARDDRDFGTVSPEEAAALADIEANGVAEAATAH